MNYLSHFYYNQKHPDINPVKYSNEFHLGVAFPDMISAFNRKCRIDFKRVQMLKTASSNRQAAFLEGVQNHEWGDRIFHSSEYFDSETLLITNILKRYEFTGMFIRYWFVSHILLEMLLDHKLTRNNMNLPRDFWDEITQVPNFDLEAWSFLICKRDPEGLKDFFARFKSSNFILRYTKLEDVLYGFNRVMERARQDTFENENSKKLHQACKEILENLRQPVSIEEMIA